MRGRFTGLGVVCSLATLGACGGDASSASSAAGGGGATASASTGATTSSSVGGDATSSSASTAGAAVGGGGAGGDATGSSSSSSSSSTAGTGGAPELIDACASKPAPACPSTSPSGVNEGGGLKAIDRCAFPIARTGAHASYAAIAGELAAALPKASIADVLGDTNRVATQISAAAVPGDPPAVKQAFTWENGDDDVEYWIPQGITGSADQSDSGLVGGKRALLVSWYYKKAADPGSTAEKGARISFVDATNPKAVKYRHVILVEPTRASDGTASFKSAVMHAGGMVWWQNKLFVAATGSGFRVFDLDGMLQVTADDKDTMGWDAATKKYRAHGYKYVLPESDRYKHESKCSPVFSFVSLDRSSPTPTLVSGEYDGDGIYGRVYRWPLDPAAPRLAADKSWPEAAYYEAQQQIQGAAVRNGTWYLSSSKPAGGAGDLYRTAPNKPAKTLGWGDTAEDLYVDEPYGAMWSLTEAPKERAVYAVSLSAIEP